MTGALPLLDAATGVVLTATGVVAWRARPSSRVGALLVLTAACWFAGSLVGVLAFLHRGPLVQLHVSYPTGRVPRRTARAVVGLAWLASLAEGLAPTPWLTSTLSVLVAGAALDIYRRSSGNARKAGGPALASALLFAAVLALASGDRLFDLGWDQGIAVTYDVVVVGIAGWLTLDLLSGRWTEATVADLVSQLGERPDAVGLRSALGRALGDPNLVVGYRVPGQDQYVDDEGNPVAVIPAGDQVVTLVEDQGVPVAAVVHSPTVLQDPDLAHGAVAAVRLAVGNARLRSRIEEQSRVLMGARRGLVESADRQRAAVSRALADGADRHLARVGELLTDQDAADLRAELAAAREDLRALAAGVRPPELETSGPAGALPLLAARSPVPATADVRIGRLEPVAESALYFICAEALTNIAKHAQASRVAVRCRSASGWVVLTITDNGRGGADPRASGLRGLADRVEALGGTLTVRTGIGSGTTVEARLPAEEVRS